MDYKKTAQELLALADVKINGDRPWDIRVKNDAFYARVFNDPELGVGESFMDGWWDCDRLDELAVRVLHSDLPKRLTGNYKLMFRVLQAKFLNLAPRSKAFEVGQHHYDIGNDLYKAMLDKRMVYTCGYWKDAKNLDEAQEAKLDLVCRKIGLTKGQKVLDIGGGWGSFAQFAAEKYGAHVVNVTVSKEQVALANERCKGLSVENRLQDYRDVNEKFDRIVSLGMFEHVGYKNYHTYMEVVHKNLKDDGLFLLHSIGQKRTGGVPNPWTLKYIFPNSMLPSVQQIAAESEDLFVMEDWHNFGAYYDPTLMAWWHNFDAHWPELKDKYGDRFYRMWKLYLLGSAAGFRSRSLQLWQVVFSKNGVQGGYQSVR